MGHGYTHFIYYCAKYIAQHFTSDYNCMISNEVGHGPVLAYVSISIICNNIILSNFDHQRIEHV